MHPITDPDLAAAADELRALCERLTADLLELAASMPAARYPIANPLHNHQGSGAS